MPVRVRSMEGLGVTVFGGCNGRTNDLMAMDTWESNTLRVCGWDGRYPWNGLDCCSIRRIR